MIKHYLKHAYKSVLRDRFHSFLNIFGLSIGITISIITLLFVQSEYNYDSYHKNADRIFLFGVNMTIGDRSSSQTYCSRAVGPVLKQYIPGIDKYVRLGRTGEVLVSGNEKRLYEKNFHYADAEMFEVFSTKFYMGSAENCLKEPNTIVLTKSLALKYFNRVDPVDEVLEVGNLGLFKVTAVVEDTPDNSHIDFDALLSFSTIYSNTQDKSDQISNFGGQMLYLTYFLLNEGFTVEEFFASFQAFYDQNIKGSGMAAERINYKPLMDNLKSYRLDSTINPEYSSQNRQFLRSFIYIGIFILILACINYINMSTSRAAFRAKEIGLKKVLGSQRLQIIFQLLGESFITTLIAFLIAFGLTEYILEFTGFNDIIGRELVMNTFSNSFLIVSAFVLLLVIAFLSGIYPSIYMSGLNPVKAFKEDKVSKSSKSVLRNVLIVVQFSISIMVITLSFMMNGQLKYILKKDLGFKKDNVLVIRIKDDKLKAKMTNFKRELQNYTGINGVSYSYSAPSINLNGFAFKWETNDGEMETHALRQMIVDKDFYPTLGIEILKGQNFYRDTEVSNLDADMIVNEAMVRFMGWDDPIGKKCSYGRVIGVVKDFNYSSLYSDIRPMYSLNPFPGFMPEILIVNLKGNNLHEAMDYIEKKWYDFAPDQPFNYTFLDDDIRKYYKQDQQQMKISSIFSALCIFISSLGLFGLTSFVTMRRRKEVAIRKTFGANISQVISALFKNVLVLIVVASVIAIPFAYWVYEGWMQNFVYKVEVNYLIFLWCSLGAIVFAFIISLYHYLKVVNSNIVDSLRYE